MRTFYNKLAVLSLAGFVLAACGTSNNVVSGHLISKRKVNKGFFINHSKNLKSDDAEAQEVRQPFIQYSPEAEELTAQNVPAEAEQVFAAVENNPPVFSDEAPDDFIMESDAVSEAPKPVEKRIETVSPPKTAKTKIDKGTRAEFRQAKKDFSQTGREDGVRLLILVIICIFIPPLAVYLSEGRWNSTCWINLLLTLLFFLPGLIHGLIVILT
ncbi:MAG: YqaE/Pmp3 family rane protein [Crocinitomicaceae bacterium]|jgi:uncharacterized membrane protein YqaE (UPF0057 family)|nr:YqaE/Pmp3 family rane protein [Crocinitomicaceae bacterium]